MKQMKKLLAILLAVTTVMALAAPALAATEYPVEYSQYLDGNDYDFSIAQAPERAVSMSQATTEMMLALGLADKMAGTNNYLRYAQQNADYLLGRNATGYCYVTGFGTFSPKAPHHRLSHADKVIEPLPGFLVGGSNPGQQDKKDVQEPYKSSQPDESYLDNMGSYASNEIAINWNASLAALICWIEAEE